MARTPASGSSFNSENNVFIASRSASGLRGVCIELRI
jgi:hypothetical protein